MKSLENSEARRLLSEAGDDGLADAILVVLRSCGQDGRWLNLSQMAELVDMSVRSLQRKLHEQDAVFSELVDQTREQQATDMLTNSEAPLREIASRLGYSSQANFSRAYQRLTGRTPREMRDR